MSDVSRRWLIFGGIAAVGLLIAVVAISNTSASPRAFLRDHYRCTPDPTDYDSATCTASGTPSELAAAIAADTRPIDRGQDDGMEFMQYEDDIIAISADTGSGSTINIDDYDTGYRHYSSHFVFFGWTSYRPSGGGFGGGGYGGGGYGGGGK